MEVVTLRNFLLFLTNLHLIIKLSDEKVSWVDGFDRKFVSKSDASLEELERRLTNFRFVVEETGRCCIRKACKTSN